MVEAVCCPLMRQAWFENDISSERLVRNVTIGIKNKTIHNRWTLYQEQATMQRDGADLKPIKHNYI